MPQSSEIYNSLLFSGFPFFILFFYLLQTVKAIGSLIFACRQWNEE